MCRPESCLKSSSGSAVPPAALAENNLSQPTGSHSPSAKQQGTAPSTNRGQKEYRSTLVYINIITLIEFELTSLHCDCERLTFQNAVFNLLKIDSNICKIDE